MTARTYDYAEPAHLLKALGDDPGRTLIERIARGELPGTTLAATLGMRPVLVEDGRVEITLTCAPHLANVMGTLHGGAIASLCDAACGFAVISTLGPREWFTTMDLSTKMLRGSGLDGQEVRAVGEVIRRGRRTAVAEARVYTERAKLLATSVSSCLILDRAEVTQKR